jgi:sporulation protein YlmC with PRC-barrel domain
MEIPLNAQVKCTDGVCGHSVYVLIDPVTDKVTHLVVQEDSFANTEYIVPVNMATETIAETIQLRCSKAELVKMEPFLKTKYVEQMLSDSYFEYGEGTNGLGGHYYMPYVTPDMTVQVPVDEPQIPPGELMVCRGTRISASDGYVGHIDEFVVNPQNGRITHLVMREGHLWGQKDVIIPVSAMGETIEDTLFLKLDKQQIEALPTFPLQRRWS